MSISDLRQSDTGPISLSSPISFSGGDRGALSRCSGNHGMAGSFQRKIFSQSPHTPTLLQPGYEWGVQDSHYQLSTNLKMYISGCLFTLGWRIFRVGFSFCLYSVTGRQRTIIFMNEYVEQRYRLGTWIAITLHSFDLGKALFGPRCTGLVALGSEWRQQD